MSGTPPQRGDHSTADKPHLNLITHPSYEHEPSMATSYQSCRPQEPPRFLFPDSHNYDPTISHRLPMHGRFRDAGIDSRHCIPGNVTQNTAQWAPFGSQRGIGSIDAGASSSYNDIANPGLSYSRNSARSGGRANDAESQYSSSTATLPSPVYSDKSAAAFPCAPAALPQPPAQQRLKTGMPLGFDKLLNHSPAPQSPPQPPPATKTTPKTHPTAKASPSRYHLHIRQQPLAARACGAGDRDRRPVDPPPIIQMLLTDFNPGSAEDKEILKDPRFTVGCFLFLAPPSPSTSSSNPPPNTAGNTHPQPPLNPEGPLLSGKAFVSPFHVSSDPDPSTSPSHPSTNPQTQAQPIDPSIPRRPMPSTFFIFSDLSIRSAGVYRFQFRLMNWGSVQGTGQSMPILAEAWSEPFRVYPAKDFPGMRDSSLLAEGLKEAGFVELKTRGKGRGKGRRRGRG